MHNSQEIANKIKSLAESKGFSISKILHECGLNKNALYTMQASGYFPRVDSLTKIADCLDCSVDYLLGRTESETLPKTPVETETIEYYLKLDSLAKTEIDNAVRKLMTEQNNRTK